MCHCTQTLCNRDITRILAVCLSFCAALFLFLHPVCFLVWQSSSSSVGILIDTHTSLIRKTLIAVQQTAGIDVLLDRHIAQTRVALTELEKGVEALVAEDALHATRRQLQAELAAAGGNSSTAGRGGGDAGAAAGGGGGGSDGTERPMRTLQVRTTALAPPQPAGLFPDGEDEGDNDDDGHEHDWVQPLPGVQPHQQASSSSSSSFSNTAQQTPQRQLSPQPSHVPFDAL
jgi:hypothetical protein